jgi:hypothetical protein
MVERCHVDPRFQRENGCHPRNSALPNQIHLVKLVGSLRILRAQPVAAREVHRERILLPDHQAEEKALGVLSPGLSLPAYSAFKKQSDPFTVGDGPGRVKEK